MPAFYVDLPRMYGAGKLLLKDTVLEMKANRRYGVVGHNGPGNPEGLRVLFDGARDVKF